MEAAEFVQLFIDLKGKASVGIVNSTSSSRRSVQSGTLAQRDWIIRKHISMATHVTLICELFNTNAQWSKDKVRIVVEAIMCKIAKRRNQQTHQ
jgi:hypothetical protein